MEVLNAAGPSADESPCGCCYVVAWTGCVLCGVHLIVIGGFLQLLAGFMSYRRNDHLTGSAFIVFASLWTIQGINHIMMTSLPQTAMQYGVLPGMIGFMALSVVLSMCAATVNYIMPPVLVAIMIALIFEGVGLFFLWGRRVAAAFEIIIALSGIYGVVVMTLKGVSQRYILPGFGNAPYDVLLVRTKAPKSKQNEKKKNTKYAEPMGMGFIGNVVPATVFAFYHFGFFTDFRPAIPMFLNSLFCHLCASYYSFLRQDFFNAILYIIYTVFWTSKGITELLITMDFAGIETLRTNFYGQWALLVIMLILLVCSMCQTKILYLYNLLFTLLIVLSLDHIPIPVYNFTFGVPCCLIAIFSLFMSTSYLINSIAEKTVLYVGAEVCDVEKLRRLFERLTACTRSVGAKVKYYDESLAPGEVVETLCFLGNTSLAFVLRPASLAVITLHTLGMFFVMSFHKIWIPFTLFFELNMIAFVIRCFAVNQPWMNFVTALLAGIVSLYGTFAGMTNGTLQGHLVPLGDPILKASQPPVRLTKLCPTFTSKRTSAILKAAKILTDGGIVGVPTDTVYALAASCKLPNSIKNIYTVKERPSEKPICICLSNLKQLEEAKPDFCDLLWAFMRLCYPGKISCVVPKGEWLLNLGLGDATEYIGNKESVCIRIPDSSILAYLTQLTGPVALSSANPSGGEDSIHHDMVLESLGHKIDGMICDGESRETAPSTVVNCVNINKGEISFFRIGCAPQDHVENLFEEAKKEINFKPQIIVEKNLK
ncbi:uncharacterized protein LOC106868648 [Octopus bimaculoides]|uniref:uncharacterized protein LOC106868648 n=1 Tax=Octopus bimaculoides TaxID=37653 RepID=UPI0022E2E2C6|nr:uncharacterized protein LOC106868648 [Octopus bimaculoides]